MNEAKTSNQRPKDRTLPLSELVSFGFLQEANRGFFHPLGLALAVVVEDDGSFSELKVFDYRDDPEGVLYSFKGDEQDAIEKASRVALLRESKAAVRTALLGNTWQSIPETRRER